MVVDGVEPGRHRFGHEWSVRRCTQPCRRPAEPTSMARWAMPSNATLRRHGETHRELARHFGQAAGWARPSELWPTPAGRSGRARGTCLRGRGALTSGGARRLGLRPQPRAGPCGSSSCSCPTHGGGPGPGSRARAARSRSRRRGPGRNDPEGLARAALAVARPTPPLPGLVDDRVVAAIEEAAAAPGVSAPLRARLMPVWAWSRLRSTPSTPSGVPRRPHGRRGGRRRRGPGRRPPRPAVRPGR